jgi:hypothetical protein
MNAAQINWDEDLHLSLEESYQALVHSLERTKGFNLLFVRCSPAEGDRIIKNVRSDLPKKTIEEISLKEPIDNLYNRVAALANLAQINVLFIKGIEYSMMHGIIEVLPLQIWESMTRYSNPSIGR